MVRLATHHDLTLQIGSERFFDLVTHEKCDSIRILKEKNLKFLKQEIWRLTGARPSQQRLWLWAKRQNATFRPDKPLQLECAAASLLRASPFRFPDHHHHLPSLTLTPVLLRPRRTRLR